MSAAVYPRRNRAELDNLVLKIKDTISWKFRKPLHFTRIRNGKRECLVNAIAGAHTYFRSIIVMVHKPSLEEQETFRDRHRLYFYAVRFVLERASWLCRDSKAARDLSLGDGTATVTFSSRNDLPYDEMRAYFCRLQRLETSIDWSVIQPNQFETLTNGRKSGLQIVDTVASAFYCADHHCTQNLTDRWAEALRPTLYRNASRYRGYGLKFFPFAAEKQIAQGTLAPWANRIYPM